MKYAAAELTAHIRSRLKHEGIKARCRYSFSCGVNVLRIYPPTYEARFTEAEERTIRIIAVANRLTHACGQPIDIERMTGSCGETFELPFV